MKKKLAIITSILTIVSAVYAVYAMIQTRGLKVYRIGTTLGKILTRSYQPAACAAFVLCIVSILLILSLKKNKDENEELLEPVRPEELLEPEKGEAGKGSAVKTNELTPPDKPVKAAVQKPAGAAVFCMKCGNKRTGNEKFCTECGNPF